MCILVRQANKCINSDRQKLCQKDGKPFAGVLWQALWDKSMNVIENDKGLLNDFIRLNEEWISFYFEIEDVDRKLAANPSKILEDGGYIFSLVSEGKVQGVCALFNEGDGVYELARIAVSPNSQGNGYGSKLIEVCLSKLVEIGAKKVCLVSNTKLESAISLYKKYDFITVSEGQHPVYARANIVMERHVS